MPTIFTKSSTLLRRLGLTAAFLGASLAAFVLGSGVLSLGLEVWGNPGAIVGALAAGGLLGSVVRIGARFSRGQPKVSLLLAVGLHVVLVVSVGLGLMVVELSRSWFVYGLGVAAGVAGVLLFSRPAWAETSPRFATAIRWATLPLVVVSGAETPCLLILARELVGSVGSGAWLVGAPLVAPLIAGVAAMTVWGVVRVAPGHRKTVLAIGLPVVLGAGVLAAGECVFLGISLVEATESTAWFLGAAAGALAGWREAGTRSAGRVSPVAGAGRRYKGMTPFQDAPQDRRTFFGREREARSLQSLVLAERLVVLFGKSGMGKTSLINAGLVEPLRRRGYFPMVVRLADSDEGPVASLFDGVREAAHAGGVELVEGDGTSVLSFFGTAEIWSESDDLLRPVLILDQFEELFTLHQAGPRREFIRQLAELVRGPAAPPDLKVVLTLREDFLAELEELALEIPGILRHRFRLGPFLAESAREAIVGPAALEGASFGTAPFVYREEAVERILEFLARRRQGAATVEGAEIEPAHLQLVCQYLEERVVERRMMDGPGAGSEVTAGDLGGDERLGRILEGFYDRTLAAIGSPGERKRVRRLCERRLISEGGRRLTEDSEEIERQHGVPAQRLRQLVDARLLRAEPRLGGVFYELSHDTLVEPIRRSGSRRRAARRNLMVAAGTLLAGWLGFWWLWYGRTEMESALQSRNDALALSELNSRLPRPGDPAVFEKLAREKLGRIEQGYPDWTRSVELYGSMVGALADIERNFPSLVPRTEALRREVRASFVAQHREAPDAAEDTGRGVRIVDGVTGVKVQAYPVTNGEYRRFDPVVWQDDDEVAAGRTWYEATAYADWLGGRLPTREEWERARERPSSAVSGEWLGEDPGSGLCAVGLTDSAGIAGLSPAMPCDLRMSEIGFRVAFRPVRGSSYSAE